MEFSATLSDDRVFRYLLWRKWDENLPYAMFIGLNPSTADEEADDPTIRRCIGFAKAWGLGALCMANLFAFRATDPAELKTTDDPVGPENDHWIDFATSKAGIVVAAWGNGGNLKNRAEIIRERVKNLHCLKITNSGEPGHPLYLSKDLKPFPLGNPDVNSSPITEDEKPKKEELLRLFVEQVVYLHRIHTTILNLYERTDEKLLRQTAEGFFDFLYPLLTHKLLLEIAKLTDQSSISNRDNLTVRYVAGKLLSEQQRKSPEIRSILADLQQFGIVVSDARNKILGHNDLETFRKNLALSSFEERELDQFFESLSKFSDIISKEIRGHIVGDIYTGTEGDEIDLLQQLRRAVAYQKAFEEGDYEMRQYLFGLLPR